MGEPSTFIKSSRYEQAASLPPSGRKFWDRADKKDFFASTMERTFGSSGAASDFGIGKSFKSFLLLLLRFW